VRRRCPRGENQHHRRLSALTSKASPPHLYPGSTLTLSASRLSPLTSPLTRRGARALRARSPPVRPCLRPGSRRRVRACSPAVRGSSTRSCRAPPGAWRAHGACWPMRCARSIACASTAGFHHGSSRYTYSAAVRLRPCPPALRLMRNTGVRRVRLEARHARLAIRVRPSRYSYFDARRVEPRTHERQEARELREHQRLVSLGGQLLQRRHERIELRARQHAPQARVDQHRMARRLPQPQQPSRMCMRDLAMPSRSTSANSLA
jgi:hypothetical protein